MTRLTIRIDFDDERQIGHGKIRLIEMVGEHGSISAAARAMGMSYRRAWLLLDEVNRMFSEPVVEKQLGGKGGGNAKLTKFGKGLVELYRALEVDMGRKFGVKIQQLEERLATEKRASA